ncbi:cytochrome c biogenesis protein CcsA [uncultured Bacteroides sp.]|uniref:cytochrome c biogenesis protein CcsA n=1 Tax=uncultured Bacteroides sp. TaxID=162156 RepID=UPI002AABEDF7|nr:cytochrome c biogenesis protein CcsA [uncultured Bacteroides sp.]
MKKQIPFGIYIAIIVCMAMATFVEKVYGTDVTFSLIYNSWWFICLWIFLTIAGFLYMLKKLHYKCKAPFLLHSSLVLILAGALVTHLTSVSGIIHLRKDLPTKIFMEKKGDIIHFLPFSIMLNEFRIQNYPGTEAPMDYVSLVTVTENNSQTKADISMNHILTHRGYRFLQSSFDDDGKGSYLSVNYDPWGILITYSGYLLLAISMILVLVSKEGEFRRLLQHPLLKKLTFIFILLLTYGHSNAAELPVLPADVAAKFGRVQILYNDRMAPLQTVARDFTLKLCGMPSYNGFTAEQIFTAWIFFPDQWSSESIIKVKSVKLQEMLCVGKMASLNQFFTTDKKYKLQQYYNAINQGEQQNPLSKAIIETDERVELIKMLQSGEMLKLFPCNWRGRIQWLSPKSDFPVGYSKAKVAFSNQLLSVIRGVSMKHQSDDVIQYIDKLRRFQINEGGQTVLSERRIDAERLYNRMNASSILFPFNLTLGLLGFILFLFAIIKMKRSGVAKETVSNHATTGDISRFGSYSFIHKIQIALVVLLSFSFIFHTFSLALRTYISDRLPLSNGYEIMQFIAWLTMLFSLIFSRKFILITSFGFLLSGFTLLVSSLGQMNPQITPLMPVLLSPWLSLHVSLIMMSYALFSFTVINAVTALILNLYNLKEEVTSLTLVSRLLLYPATFLLGLGIFIGAVWANESWNSYWMWDPKEVWALISFMVYALALHTKSFKNMSKPLFFHVYMIFSFLTVLMTYFGVNYFLGGMHSYNG